MKKIKKMMNNLKFDIFDMKQDIMKVFRKYNFNIINDLSQLKTINISYFNFRRNKINDHVQKSLVQIPEICKDYVIPFTYWNEKKTQQHTYYYYPEQLIVCKIHYQGKTGDRLYVNYHYKITWIDKKNKKLALLILMMKKPNR